MEEVFISALPITDYFNETINKIEGEITAIKWLQYIDDDTLNMMHEYIDNFNEKEEKNIKEDEVFDIIKVSRLIAIMENDFFDVNGKLAVLVNRFFIFIKAEFLRRKNLVEIKGSGKITQDDTKIDVTEKGLELQEFV